MAVNSLNRAKLEEERKKRAKKFKEEVKRFHEKSSPSLQVEQERKDNVVEIYQNMSPSQKAAFEKELEKKKIFHLME